VSARRRLATPWMLTLRAPSFHVGAGRAFARCVPTSDVSCRLSAPARRLLLRPPASASCTSLERTRSVVTARPESFHRPLALEEPSPLSREDGGTTRGVFCRARILCLPSQIHTAFQPCTPDTSRRRTEPFVMLSLLRSSVTPAHRFARVLALPSTSAAIAACIAARSSTAPRGSSGLEMSVCPPCQRTWQLATG
jgi:hypothetical protein